MDVCPVDCFHEGENMLVIDPEECIDGGVCIPECPVDAIVPDIRRTLEETNWKISGGGGAAEVLGLNPSTLRARMRKLGIKRFDSS